MSVKAAGGGIMETAWANLVALVPYIGFRAAASDFPGSSLEYTAAGWTGTLGQVATVPALEAISKTNLAPGCNAFVPDIGLMVLPTGKAKWTSPSVLVSGGFATFTALNSAATLYADGQVAYVTNDSTAANNGLWRKVGATGGGTWTQAAYDRVALVETSVAQTNKLKSDFACGKNKFDMSDSGVLVGKYLADNNGSVQTSANYTVTGYIHVVAGTTYTVPYKHTMVWYDASQTLLSISPSTDSNKAQTAPAGACFLRCSFYTVAVPIGAFQVEVSASGVPSAWEPFHGTAEVFDRLSAIENAETFNTLKLSLTDAAQLQRAGGTLQGGAIGASPAFSLPINWNLPGVFEVDFQWPADPNIAATPYEVMSLTENGLSSPFFKLSFAPANPTVGYYVQNASMGITVIGAASPLTQYFTPPLGAPNTPDAFSIRKVTPTSSDVTIICEVMTDRVKVYNGGTTIGEWLFSGYATVTALTAQMRIDLGSDYVVTDYCVAGFVPSDLARNIVYLCKAIPTVEPVNGTPTGGTTYDSFESYMPVKGLNIWHRLRAEINLYASNPTWVQINVYLDGKLIFNENNAINLKTTGRYTYYLNYSPTGGTGANMPVRNFSYTNTFKPLERVAVVMLHVIQDGPELPATGNAEVLTSGRLQWFIATAKSYGWTFITYDEFIDMVLGHKPKIDMAVVLLNDDSKFNWDDQPLTKALLHQNGIKCCTGLMTWNFNFSANATMIQRVLMARNQICSHADNHLDLTKLSYAQFTSNLNLSKSKTLAAGYDIDTLIAPGGYMSPEGGRWMMNNGWSLNFTTPSGANVGVLNNYYSPRTAFNRITIDDWIARSYITAFLASAT